MNETFTTIASFQYSSEAEIVKGRLEADGIQVFLSDNVTIDTNPLYSNAIGGVKLKVLSTQTEEAEKILRSIKKYSLDNEGKMISCPNCHSQKTQLFSTIKDAKSLFWFIFGIFFSVFPFYTKYKYKCEECKTEFNLK
jgi:DNA-directed RNA polymerase subunit RPC12/RpoP